MHFNIADLFESLVDVIPDRTAVVCGDKRCTWGELEARANRLAHYLQGQGVGPGDHVGLHMFNCLEFVEAMLAAFKLRAVGINVNYRYVTAELHYIYENSDMVALLTQREFGPMVTEAVQGLDALTTIVYLEDGSDAAPPAGGIAYEAALAEQSPERDFAERSGEDIYIIYTGGTTGSPKGVMWHHEDVFFAGLQGGVPGGDPIETPEQLAANAVDEDNFPLVMMPVAPFIHGAAQWAGWIGMFTGGTLVIQEGRSFDPNKVWDLVHREQVTTITLVGDAMASPLLDVLRERNEELDTECLVAIASAGAVLSPHIRDGLQELLPFCMVLNNFGATEAGHQGSAYPGMESESGRPTFEMDETNAVLGEDLMPVEPGSGVVGRLARTGRLPQGYYKDPVKTNQRFVTGPDGRRWVVPGDFAFVEEDGSITVLGRGSYCINTGGEKVFPEEVEEALKLHEDVEDALAVGIPDPKWMQRVAAVVQLRPGATPSADALVEHCRTHIAGYKVPRVVIFRDEVSRQPSGKPDYPWAQKELKAHLGDDG